MEDNGALEILRLPENVLSDIISYLDDLKKINALCKKLYTLAQMVAAQRYEAGDYTLPRLESVNHRPLRLNIKLNVYSGINLLGSYVKRLALIDKLLHMVKGVPFKGRGRVKTGPHHVHPIMGRYVFQGHNIPIIRPEHTFKKTITIIDKNTDLTSVSAQDEISKFLLARKLIICNG